VPLGKPSACASGQKDTVAGPPFSVSMESKGVSRGAIFVGTGSKRLRGWRSEERSFGSRRSVLILRKLQHGIFGKLRF
jgi:hypothetical protein